VTTDGHDSYPRAIRETLGEEVIHRCNTYLNNRIEQDHRGVKQRYYPMRGFGNVDAAGRFCRAFDEQRHYFRIRTMMRQAAASLAEQRREYCARSQALMSELMAA
jgi:putative transposase